MHKMTLISLKMEKPSSEGELAPTNEGLSNAVRHGFNPAPWPRPFTEATYNERDESRPLTPPSPINLREEDLEMTPQTPPLEWRPRDDPLNTTNGTKQQESSLPFTFNTTQEDAPRRPVKDRLGLMQDYVQDETPKRPVKDRLGTRRSKRNIRPFNPFKRGCAPPRSAEFNRETWDRDQAGYWYPI